jgi:sucrose-6-phosphate hydrolase SacC (GH32 family)
MTTRSSLPIRAAAVAALAMIAVAWTGAVPAPQGPLPSPTVRPTGASDAEALRPRIHFTPPRNFMNDPNGLVYYKGEYHLFYQYNPQGTTWGHMSWGHAVSPDLLHWQHLPVALSEQDGVMIFSGSAVVDRENTSGLCRPRGEDRSCLVAIYTGHGHGKQTQNLAVSQDRGRTWTKYPGNPVIDLGLKDFRDPKVFWHAPTRRWVMVTVLSDQHKVRLFSSPDLRTWTMLSDFGPAGATGGVWECPDLMEVPIEHAPGQSRWVLDVDINPGAPWGGSGGQYFVGTFDGTRFVADGPTDVPRWVDHGKDFYASISFSDLPAETRGPIWMGWASNWQYANEEPTTTWRGAQSLPRRLLLRRTPDGLRLVQQPTGSLASLFEKDGARHQMLVERATLPDTADLTFVVGRGDVGEIGLRLFNDVGEEVLVAVSADRRELSIDRRRSRNAPAPAGYAERHAGPLRSTGQVPVRVLIDRSVIEVFANEGETVMTERVYPTRPFTHVEWIGGRRPVSASTRLMALRSIWSNR